MTNDEIELIAKRVADYLKDQVKEKEYIDVNEASRITGFSVASLYQYVNQRRVPFIKREGKLIFKRAELRSWLDQGSCSPRISQNNVRGARILI